jgi:hypothetical protein
MPMAGQTGYDSFGSPAISIETSVFPPPPHDGFGFIGNLENLFLYSLLASCETAVNVYF